VITSGSPQSVNHIYGTAGKYTVKVTATAPDGRTATNTISVTIS
jgi:PKD repeat protein